MQGSFPSFAQRATVFGETCSSSATSEPSRYRCLLVWFIRDSPQVVVPRWDTSVEQDSLDRTKGARSQSGFGQDRAPSTSLNSEGPEERRLEINPGLQPSETLPPPWRAV